MNILIVDDDALVVKALSTHLADEGHIVRSAKDGSEANDFMENENKPDLIILDLLMPNISGLTFMTILRNFHHYSIPVIVISSLQKGDILAAQAGFSGIDFVAKPFSFEEITQKVNNHIKN
jgi:two-component system sensor histidine kinase ChiS